MTATNMCSNFGGFRCSRLKVHCMRSRTRSITNHGEKGARPLSNLRKKDFPPPSQSRGKRSGDLLPAHVWPPRNSRNAIFRLAILGDTSLKYFLILKGWGNVMWYIFILASFILLAAMLGAIIFQEGPLNWDLWVMGGGEGGGYVFLL